MAPFYGPGSTTSRLEAVYFLPLSSQKFLVVILSTSEWWKADPTLEPTGGFEHGTPGLGIQHLNHLAIAPFNSKILCHSQNKIVNAVSWIAVLVMLFQFNCCFHLKSFTFVGFFHVLISPKKRIAQTNQEQLRIYL